MMFYGGTIPPEGSFTIHFDTYQNVPVWNEPSADFVAVYRFVRPPGRRCGPLTAITCRDQDNVYDNRLCSRVQNPSAPIPFKDTPLNIRISLLGPGLLTPGSTNNVPDPSRQSRLRVNYWSEGESEPAIPLLECGIDTGSIFKTSTLGEQNRRVWVGAASLTGESANRHLIESASARYCDVQNAAPTSGLVQACTCNPNSTLSGTTCVANSTSSSGLSVGAIVGIAIGGVAALLLAAGLAWYFLRKKPAKPVAVDGLTDVESKAPVTVSSADKPVAAPPATVVFPTTTASALPTAATAYATPPTLLAAAGTAAAPKSEIPFNTAALSPSQGITPGTEMVCVMPYVPSQTDEMVLNRGDRIAVVEVFEDGWAVGENTTTRARGHFPLAAAIRADELGS
ncbi:hypothetical protein DFJ74DRAFT_393479 [Hyaloraphidium curvatum]|nr:hypothetical protein DFJ74DRAFT_393479 [Hyaloraphidium curvatum]